MNIPQSAIEPFEPCGIPTLKSRLDPYVIVNALREYIESVCESQRSLGMDGGADPRIVVDVVEELARVNGAYSALCTHLGDIQYKLTFNLPGSNLVIGKQFLVP